MDTVSEERHLTLKDLIKRFGPMLAHRIRNDPPPGMATEEDWIRISESEDRLWELVDGVLVEKAMGYYESGLAAVLIYFVRHYLENHDLGIVVGADGASRYAPGLVRIPDVSFVSWKKLPEGKTPREPLPDLVPDLAVEVLSEGNTVEEMERKLKEYFKAGVQLVWYIDPKTQAAQVYHSPKRCAIISKDGLLDGGKVLPGFSLSLKELFARADRAGR